MRILSLVAVLITLAATATPALAQRQKKTPVPDLIQGGQPDDKHDWTLGPTGARGWIWGWRRETIGANQILVTDVAPESPADGQLRVGDVILGVFDEPFSESWKGDPRRALGAAIARAESEEGKGRLPLQVWRDGKVETVTLRLRVLGGYADTAPWNCEKSDAILDAACEHIVANMKGDIDGMMNALALLATGRKEYAEPVAKLARRVGDPSLELSLGGRTSGLLAWEWGYRSVFLCEYYLATRDRSVMPAILEYSEAIAQGQSRVGTWGHGMAWPDLNGGELHGRLGGYGALNQAGLVCHLALVLAEKCGVKSKEVKQAIEKANLFASFYSGKGAIPYGDHRPGWHSHDDNGKNSLAAVIFDLQGREEEAQFFARMTIASYGERERGHTGNYFSYLWSSLGAGRAGPAAVAAFLAEQRWFYDLNRTWNGGYPYQGGAGMSGSEHKYGGWDCTAAFVFASTLPMKKLYITGRGRDASNDLSAEEVADAIECGRGFDCWSEGADYYGALETEDLMGRLQSWSPATRFRAGTALAERSDAPVKELVARLDDDSLDVRYGACQALGMLRRRGAPAVPKLRELLQSEDVWLRIQAAYALTGIGDAARAAIPDLLRLAVKADPQDPREFTQRYLAFCLFSRGGTLGVPGLLARNLEGVDHDLLLPAIERILVNDDGRARGTLSSVFKALPLETLAPILPSIIEGIRTPSPSGVMFSGGVRQAGVELLADHRIAEGMPLALEIMEIQKWGKKVRIRALLTQLGRYGGAARAVLPELRQLRADLAAHHESQALAKVIALCDETIDAIATDQDPDPVRSLADVMGEVKAR